MTKPTRELLKRVLELPRAERGKVAREVIASLDDDDDEDPAEVDRAWGAEIERRLRDVVEGRVKLIPGDQALADARAAVKRARGRAAVKRARRKA